MPRTHKTLKRLYVEAPLQAGAQIPLDRDQSNYLLNVLRSRAGDQTIVFNGRDGAWLAEIVPEGRKAAVLSLVEQSAEQTPPNDLWYGFAPLKSARLDYMIQKATEMGAGIIQPVMTRYTQVSHLKLERMRANAIEAAEQCEVLNVPEIPEQTSLGQLLATWSEIHGDRKLIVADEEEAAGSPIEVLTALEGQRLGLLIGPEGGFAEEERALLRDQAFTVPISLGPRILRADTAAVAALAVIQSTIGDWR